MCVCMYVSKRMSETETYTSGIQFCADHKSVDCGSPLPINRQFVKVRTTSHHISPYLTIPHCAHIRPNAPYTTLTY